MRGFHGLRGVRGLRGLALTAVALGLAACAGPEAPPHSMTGVLAPSAVTGVPGAPAPAAGSTAAGEQRVVRGTLTYRERIALPPEAVAIVELRQGADETAAPLVERRIALEGRQVPVPFELVVDESRLAAEGDYRLRGGLLVAGRAAWASELVALPAGPGPHELGSLLLQRVRPLAFPSYFRCGERTLSVGFEGEQAVLRIDGQERAGGSAQAGGPEQDLSLVQARSASGARFVAEGDPSTEFWTKGEQAWLTLRGVKWPECVAVPAASATAGLSVAGSGPAATVDTAAGDTAAGTQAGPEVAAALAGPLRGHGNEPSWRLEIVDGQLRFETLSPGVRVEGPASAQRVDGGIAYRLATQPATGPLQARVDDRVCVDTMSGMPYPKAIAVEYAGRRWLGCGGEPAALLHGAEWVVEDIGGAGIIDRSRVTLVFDAEGRVTGQGPCNRYAGSYTLTGENLRFGRTAATMRACAKALMTQERRFFDLLASIDRFGFSPDGALYLIARDATRIVARRD